mmetsp:Transcript_79949/g.216376  ORF Transcript_79949/g.216376 Transcript_79949/m.216376 type:complete len:226 (-) Transcript_79949:445-1122(-)
MTLVRKPCVHGNGFNQTASDHCLHSTPPEGCRLKVCMLTMRTRSLYKMPSELAACLKTRVSPSKPRLETIVLRTKSGKPNARRIISGVSFGTGTSYLETWTSECPQSSHVVIETSLHLMLLFRNMAKGLWSSSVSRARRTSSTLPKAGKRSTTMGLPMGNGERPGSVHSCSTEALRANRRQAPCSNCTSASECPSANRASSAHSESSRSSSDEALGSASLVGFFL